MASKATWNKWGLRLDIQTSKRPLPKTAQAYPLPDFGEAVAAMITAVYTPSSTVKGPYVAITTTSGPGASDSWWLCHKAGDGAWEERPLIPSQALSTGQLYYNWGHLEEDTTHYFRLRVQSIGGQSTYRPEVSVYVPVRPPVDFSGPSLPSPGDPAYRIGDRFTVDGTGVQWQLTPTGWVDVRALASAAAAAAAAAQATANAVSALTNDIVADDKITAPEKTSLKPHYDSLMAEQSALDAQADAFGVSRTAYDTNLNNLASYASGVSLWASMTATTDLGAGGGAVFRGYVQAVLTAKQALMNAIADKAKALADAAGAGVIVPNPNFDQDMSSTWPTMVQIARASAPAGCPTDYCGRAQARDQIALQTFPVTPGQQLYGEAWIDTTQSAHTARFGLYFENAAGALFATAYPAVCPPGAAWARRSGIITVPTGAVRAHCFCQVEAFSAFGSVYFTGLRISDGIPAQTGVNTINDPDTLSLNEKPQIIQDYAVITGEHAGLLSDGATYAPTERAAYVAAYDALVVSYLPTLTSPAAWNSLSGTTALGAGNRVALWNPKWHAVRDTANALRSANVSGAYNLALNNAATDAQNKANLAQLRSQPHRVAWAYASKPALPDTANYPAGYYAITTDNRTVQVNPAGTAWDDVLVAATAVVGKFFANQVVIQPDNMFPNPNGVPPPAGYVSEDPYDFDRWGAVDSGSPTGYSHVLNAAGIGHEVGVGFGLRSLQVSGGEQYFIEGRFYVSSGTSGIYWWARNNAGATVGSGGWGASGASWSNPKVGGTISVPATASELFVYAYCASGQSNVTSLLLRRKMDADLIVDGGVKARHLETDLAIVNTIRSTNYTAGTSSAAPVGFKESGTPFTTTYIGGATATDCQFELGGSANLMGRRLDGIVTKVEGGFVEWTTPGSYNWTCPPGIYNAEIMLVGGGGGGAGGVANVCGGGGGGGGGSISIAYSVVPGTVYAITVGSGGAGGAAGGNGVAGGYSQFGSSGDVRAFGGGRGLNTSEGGNGYGASVAMETDYTDLNYGSAGGNGENTQNITSMKHVATYQSGGGGGGGAISSGGAGGNGGRIIGGHYGYTVASGGGAQATWRGGGGGGQSGTSAGGNGGTGQNSAYYAGSNGSGSGAGGGGGSASASTGYAGGAGGGGYASIRY